MILLKTFFDQIKTTNGILLMTYFFNIFCHNIFLSEKSHKSSKKTELIRVSDKIQFDSKLFFDQIKTTNGILFITQCF